jgi:hypothetical protein
LLLAGGYVLNLRRRRTAALSDGSGSTEEK